MIKVGDLVRFKGDKALDDCMIGLTVTIKLDVAYILWINCPYENPNLVRCNIKSLIKVS